MTETDDSKQTTTVSKTVKLEEDFKKLLKDYISEGGLEETTAQALYAKFKNYKTDEEKFNFYHKACQSFEAATENYEFIREYRRREQLFNDTMELNGAMEAYMNKYISEEEAKLTQEEIDLNALNQEALLNEQIYNKNSSNKVYKTLDDLIVNKSTTSTESNPTSFEHSSNLRDLNQAPPSNLQNLESINLKLQNTKLQEQQQESQFQSFQHPVQNNATSNPPLQNTNLNKNNINSINSNYFKTPTNSNQAFGQISGPVNPNTVNNASNLPPFLQQNKTISQPNTNKTEYPNFYQG